MWIVHNTSSQLSTVNTKIVPTEKQFLQHNLQITFKYKVLSGRHQPTNYHQLQITINYKVQCFGMLVKFCIMNLILQISFHARREGRKDHLQNLPQFSVWRKLSFFLDCIISTKFCAVLRIIYLHPSWFISRLVWYYFKKELFLLICFQDHIAMSEVFVWSSQVWNIEDLD